MYDELHAYVCLNINIAAVLSYKYVNIDLLGQSCEQYSVIFVSNHIKEITNSILVERSDYTVSVDRSDW